MLRLMSAHQQRNRRRAKWGPSDDGRHEITKSAPLQRYAARVSAAMDATRLKDDASEASDGGSFSVRCQGVESAWDIAGVTPETTALELKTSLAASSGIALDSQRLIFQGARAAHRLRVAIWGARRVHLTQRRFVAQGGYSPTMRPWAAQACALARAPCTWRCDLQACQRHSPPQLQARPTSRRAACARKTCLRCASRWRRNCAPWPRSRAWPRLGEGRERATSATLLSALRWGCCWASWL